MSFGDTASSTIHSLIQIEKYYCTKGILLFLKFSTLSKIVSG